MQAMQSFTKFEFTWGKRSPISWSASVRLRAICRHPPLVYVASDWLLSVVKYNWTKHTSSLHSHHLWREIIWSAFIVEVWHVNWSTYENWHCPLEDTISLWSDNQPSQMNIWFSRGDASITTSCVTLFWSYGFQIIIINWRVSDMLKHLKLFDVIIDGTSFLKNDKSSPLDIPDQHHQVEWKQYVNYGMMAWNWWYFNANSSIVDEVSQLI